MLFTWSNNSDEILVDGHLCQRQRATMLPEGHKACQWKLERTAEYKVVWRGSQKRTGQSPPPPPCQPVCPRALWEKLDWGPALTDTKNWSV